MLSLIIPSSLQTKRERERGLMRIRAFDNGGGGKGLMAFAAMVMVECTLVGVTTLSKAVMSRGMSRYVFVVYYNGVGTLILLPSFIFSQIYRTIPPLTFPLLFRFYLLGLIGSSALMFGFTGIDYSSPTLSSAIGNLVPVFTFILAIIFRMEKVDVRSRSSQAKILGTIVSITGAFIVTLYKGPAILSISTPSIPSSSNHQLILTRSPPKSNWILGGLFISIDWFLFSTWYVLQASIVKEYPAKQTIVFFYCLFATIQSAIITLIAESDLSVWRLRADIELFAIVYSGVFGSVVSSIVHAWALHKKGPVFVAMFKPMGIIVAIVMGLIFLGDILYIGSLIGSVIIAAGFYGVMWGKSEEVIMVAEKEEEEVIIGGGSSSVTSSSSNTDVVPLLQSRKVLI